MSGRQTTHRGRRAAPPGLKVWAGCAVAALILVLGVSGTFSSWTTAVVGNSNNTVATAQAVILRESSGSATCSSSDSPTTNVSTCSTINKYGGTGSPLTPGTSQSVDVTFANTGSANASSFKLAPGACSQTPAAGSGTPAAADLCTSGDLTVAISCSPGATYTPGSAWTDLAYAAAAPPSATKAHAAAGGDLNSGPSWTCRVTTALSATASVLAQGITLSQPLTWTLVK